MFQITIEVRSMDEVSRLMVIKNKIQLDFIEINKYPMCKNEMSEINIKGFLNSLLFNFNKNENKVFSRTRNLLQRDDDFTYDLISTIVCLKKSEIKSDYDHIIRTANNKSKNSFVVRNLRNLDTTAASTNENLVSLDKTQVTNQVHEMLRVFIF